jgi:hypothetical protein
MIYNPLFGEMPSPRPRAPLQPSPPRVAHPGERISQQNRYTTRHIRDNDSRHIPGFVPHGDSLPTNNIRPNPLVMYASHTSLELQVAHRDWAFSRFQKASGFGTPEKKHDTGYFLDHNVIGKVGGVENVTVHAPSVPSPNKSIQRSFMIELQFRLYWTLVVCLTWLIGGAIAGPLGVGLLGLLVFFLMSE